MNIFVSLPCVGGLIHQKTVITLDQITRKRNLFNRYIENCSLITKGRQDHFGMFLSSKEPYFDFFLSVDADMVIMPPGILDMMIDSYPNNSIIAGLYAMKSHDVKTGFSPLNGCPIDNDK